MSGDAHVRICESLGVKFPRATRLVISINGEKRYLWRAVDQDGYVLDEIVQIHRNTKAARRLLTRLLRKQKGSVAKSDCRLSEGHAKVWIRQSLGTDR
jgi:putative transposase